MIEAMLSSCISYDTKIPCLHSASITCGGSSEQGTPISGYSTTYGLGSLTSSDPELSTIREFVTTIEPTGSVTKMVIDGASQPFIIGLYYLSLLINGNDVPWSEISPTHAGVILTWENPSPIIQLPSSGTVSICLVSSDM